MITNYKREQMKARVVAEDNLKDCKIINMTTKTKTTTMKRGVG